MAPEQCAGVGEVTGATDIYALGLVFYEMLVGKTLFGDENPFVLMKRHQEEDPRELVRRNVSDRYRELLLRMLEKEAGKRPRLEDVLSELSTGAVKVSGYLGSGEETKQGRVYGSRGVRGALSRQPRAMWVLSGILVLLMSALVVVYMKGMGGSVREGPEEVRSAEDPRMPQQVAEVPSTSSVRGSPVHVEEDSGVHKVRAVQGELAGEVEEKVGVEETRRVSVNLDRALFRGKMMTSAEKEQILAAETQRKEEERAAADAQRREHERRQRIGNQLSLGRRALEKKEYDGAISAFDKVLQEDSGHNEAQTLMAKARKAKDLNLKIPGLAGDMVRVRGGTFVMGSPKKEPGRQADEEQHKVTIRGSYWLGKHEVTQGQWKKVMGGNPSYFKACGDSCPVEGVSWLDAVRFCNRLSELVGLRPAYQLNGPSVSWNRSANGFRLPTEAEWEYACRSAGKLQIYSGGGDVGPMAWYQDNSSGSTHPVGRKSRNDLGFYDMSGNVWEWCWDWYGKYPSSPQTDPSGPARGSRRVIRGGSYNLSVRLCRSKLRDSYSPANRDLDLGFRLCRSE
eukprot:GHVU01059642.1.p1 GENE.GHVU01059642.1~~GHVU01059642.1.p1  ORF type:complete len:623 (+),score=67.29 GHVU01059642.1:171-1871(+)